MAKKYAACVAKRDIRFLEQQLQLGVAIFGAVNRYLARIMSGFPAYDVKMEEVHHVHKLDAPSGTAITLAEDLIHAVGRKDKWVKGTFTAPDGTGERYGDVCGK